MKIPRYGKSTADWPYEVSGPGTEPKKMPTQGGAIGLAQGRAIRHGAPATFYVRYAGEVTHHIERDEKGVITTTAA